MPYLNVGASDESEDTEMLLPNMEFGMRVWALKKQICKILSNNSERLPQRTFGELGEVLSDVQRTVGAANFAMDFRTLSEYRRVKFLTNSYSEVFSAFRMV